MVFWFVYSLIATLCVVLTALPLVGYCDCVAWVKFLIYALLFISWFSPILIWNWQTKKNISLKLYSIVAKIGYFMEGFAFLLMTVLLIRDAIWWSAYCLSSGWLIVSPLKDNIVADVNVVTVIIVLIASIYGVYAAEKQPKILKYVFRDKKIKKPLKILVASDLHITKITSVDKVKLWVKLLNSTKADVVLLVGDVADDVADNIKKQIKELKKIKAPLGIFYVLGNHETYFNSYQWEMHFATLGWQVLHNSGVSIDDYGIYVAGVPDNRAFRVNIEQSIRNAENEYTILMSHIPNVTKKIGDNKVDLLVSGHTHGGQIFPFNWLAKLGNAGMVSGFYQLKNTKVLISNGVGYWGPPIRLGAPSDVMMLELHPIEETSQRKECE